MVQPPDSHAASPRDAQRVAWVALVGGLVIMALKFVVFALTNSAAVLGDALESIVNVLAAVMAALSTWYAAQPPDRYHPYGHGKVEFFAVGTEGVMIVAAGLSIMIESIRRLAVGSELGDLTLGIYLLLGLNVLMGVLGGWVWWSGLKLDSPTLVADGKHLTTDVVTTAGVVGGLIAVRFTGLAWIDAALALAVAVVIFVAGTKLIRESWRGLMDRVDIEDDRLIRAVLDEAVQEGQILSYHKVRHRHTGAYHWVDLHLQVPAEMTVYDAHARASQIEKRIEAALGRANATAHIEPPLKD